MSKGHIEALRAMREAKFAAKPASKPTVTKLPVTVSRGPSTVTKPPSKKKLHTSIAAKQKAYRDRQKAKAK